MGADGTYEVSQMCRSFLSTLLLVMVQHRVPLLGMS
jgi:hypothetical protein